MLNIVLCVLICYSSVFFSWSAQIFCQILSGTICFLLFYIYFVFVLILLFFILSFESSLYIPNTGPLSGMLFADVFLSLWLVLMVSFKGRTFLILKSLTYQTFSYMDCTFCVMSKKHSPNSRSQRCTPICSFRFIILDLKFISIIYFE